MSIKSAQEKADVLIEALSYITKWREKIVVLKLGGSALEGSESKEILISFCQDVLVLKNVGMKPVVIHGGGPQIGRLMKKLGKTPEFIDGQRVTDAESLDLARMVLVGKINRDIVGIINSMEPVAVGLSGEDAGLITAQKKSPNLGYVGEITEVNPSIIHRLLNQGLVPVVATIGSDLSGQAYNINADISAGKIAAALKAEKLVYLTDVEGIYENKDDPNSLVSEISLLELKQLLQKGCFSQGMIPKVSSLIDALSNGVKRAHIINGNVAHSVLVEFFTDGGIGTMVKL
jgi:acetylglutamate kinase